MPLSEIIISDINITLFETFYFVKEMRSSNKILILTKKLMTPWEKRLL